MTEIGERVAPCPAPTRAVGTHAAGTSAAVHVPMPCRAER
jgi:hypothetical protein